MRIFRFRRRADLLLLFVDAGSAVLVSWIAYLLRFEGDTVPSSYVARYRIGAAVAAVAWIAAARVSGLYRRQALRVGDSVLAPSFESAASVGVVLLIADYVALDRHLSRAWVGLVVLGLLLAGLATRGVLRRVRRALVPLGIGLERYALVGDGIAVRRLSNDLTRAPGAPYKIVDVLSPSLGPDALAARAAADHLDGLILTAEAAPQHVADLAAKLAGYGIDAFLAPRLGELDLRVASITTFHGVPLLRVAGLAPRRRAVRQPGRGDLSKGVAILGTRGIPASYGGFETFAERLALHLVDSGIPVTVYCRRHHASEGKSWRGVRLVTLPTELLTTTEYAPALVN